MLHDAELIGLDIHRSERRLSLRLIGADSNVTHLSFVKCVHFRLGDIGLQNVVYGVQVITKRKSDDLIYLEQHLSWMSSSDGENSFMTESYKELWIEGLTTGRLKLAVISPSIGMSGAILCESIVGGGCDIDI